MTSLLLFVNPPTPCAYLPGLTARMEYEIVAAATAAEYERRMAAGWRRFGHALFRPQCESCRRCLSLRVPAATFAPNRSQRRALKANADVTVEVGEPAADDEKLDLYDRFHAFQAGHRDWPRGGPRSLDDYSESFVDNPFPTEEWVYRVGGVLVGVGYVDVLPTAMSAIYFYHDPAARGRSLGTYNVLRVLAAAAARGVPHVYLGFFVEGCASLEYKANFAPNEIRGPDGWAPFRRD